MDIFRKKHYPVSGTRQFGYELNLDGSVNFYVRGVDRFTSSFQESVASMILDDPFQPADELWENFQNSLANFVLQNGGSASLEEPIKDRPDWQKIKDILLGNVPISELGCE